MLLHYVILKLTTEKFKLSFYQLRAKRASLGQGGRGWKANLNQSERDLEILDRTN